MTRTHEARTGRKPAFYAAEVERIRADPRSTSTIADELGVSYDTIQRVRQRGRFKGVHYLTIEEWRFNSLAVGSDMVTIDGNVLYVPPPPGPVGRKFLSGRAQLTAEELAGILADPRHPREIGRDYKLQSTYVAKLRRDHATIASYGERIDELRPLILADERSDKELAMAYKLPARIIREIRDADEGRV